MNTTPRFEVSTFFGWQAQEVLHYPIGLVNPLDAYKRPQYYEQAKKAVGQIIFNILNLLHKNSQSKLARNLHIQNCSNKWRLT